ncbi:hypothetical protein P691DRAFT_784796 [Macrolepiota fuliginosa MF-IS2]|uniref:Uncharacterized protein n=1 Tax=Macrolepiota fuliginosa MF-IS2 TaxID=1400762 RepID=A0A9P5X816_9AGAR|nr:hypothetical protein P691DRAFT_784796 [Macrolepiota fuliginosa MF-IS2]
MSAWHTSSPYTLPHTHALAPRPRKQSTLDSLTLDPRKRKNSRNLKRKAAEVQEVERIMDPSYLPPRASATIGYSHGRTIGTAAEFGPNSSYGHGYDYGYERGRTTSNGATQGGWYNGHHYEVDAAGHLHDIDHRPFPMIPPQRSQSLMVTEGYSAQVPGGTQRSPRSTRRVTSPPAYWETFNTTQMANVSESESSDIETIPVSRIPCASVRYNLPPPATVYAHVQPDQNYLSAHAYFDNTTQYAIGGRSGEPVVQIDGRTGKRVLTKSRPRGKNGKENLKYDDDDDDDDDQDCILDEGYEGVDEDGRMIQNNKTRSAAGERSKAQMGPKQRLYNTWVATRFDAHLKVIRTQRWLRERVQGQHRTD